MAETYSVVLAGSVRETQTLEAVKPRLAALFKVDPARVDGLFGKGPTVLRKGLDHASARKWIAVIEQTGALCWIEPDEEAAVLQSEHRPLVTHQSTGSGVVQSPPGPQPAPVMSDSSAQSRLMQELAHTDARDPQINAQPAWADNQLNQVENPSDGSVPPADGIQPTAPAVFKTQPPATGTKRYEIPRFVKCPKCGHVAESLDDWLMTRAECPECGLLAEKFVKTYMTQPLRDPATIRPDSLLAPAGTAEVLAANGNRENAEEQHWLTFWTNPDWLEFFVGSLFLSLVGASLPPILYLAEAYTVESQRLTALNLAATGLLVWAIALIGSIACFYCYSVWERDRRIFLIHVVASLGVCAVLAVLGGALSKAFAGLFHLTDRLRLEAALTPARMLASPVLLFIALILYLGFIRLPAERNLLLYFDGPEYAAKVQDARTVAGPDFPDGHERAYEYYKFVYVETSKGASPSFDKVLRRLVADHPASFNHQHSTDATLMVLNAIGFRDDLARQGLISDKTHVNLSDLASLWGRTGHWKGVAEDPVRRFDAQCPITRGELRSLQKKASQRMATNGKL